MANPIRNAAAAALISAASLTGAFNLVDTYEGNVKTVYVDTVGVKTICRGTTTGPLIAKGKATDAECDQATAKDLLAASEVVKRCAGVPLTQGELNAWTSFAYNTGPGKKGVKDGFCVLKSGALPTHLKRLRAGDHRGACGMLPSWTYAGGKQLRGLVARRQAEFLLCVKDLP